MSHDMISKRLADRPPYCEWGVDDSESEAVYHTACGESFGFAGRVFDEVGFHFCPCCGGEVQTDDATRH